MLLSNPRAGDVGMGIFRRRQRRERDERPQRDPFRGSYNGRKPPRVEVVMDGERAETGTRAVRRQPGGNWSPDEPCALDLLARAEVEKVQMVPSGSNYVFAMYLRDEEAGPG